MEHTPIDAYRVDFNVQPAMAYYSEVNPRFLALNLIFFGVHAIRNMKIVKDYEGYKEFALSDNPSNELVEDFIHEYIYDVIKLVTAYENFMKAKLLLGKFLVHKISDIAMFKQLRKDQYEKPIPVTDNSN